MRYLATVLLCFLATGVFSQNFIYLGQKSYKSTPIFNFTLPDFVIGSDKTIPIQVGRSGNSGVMLITANSELGRAYINGPVMIYLENGKVLKLESRINTDYIDDKTISLFSINTSNLSALRESDIIRIRFNYTSSFGSKMGLSAAPVYTETRINPDNKFDFFESRQVVIRTASKINSLFD